MPSRPRIDPFATALGASQLPAYVGDEIVSGSASTFTSAL
jgi:hypothetical protein